VLPPVALIAQRLPAPRRGFVLALLEIEFRPARAVETKMPDESFGFSSIRHVALLPYCMRDLQRTI
jgi:hypothetical protein